MAEGNPNLPFERYPTQKAKCAPFSIFNAFFLDEVMKDLSVAIAAVEGDGRLPTAYLTNGEFPGGSSGWFNVVFDKCRNELNAHFPHRDNLKDFSICDNSPACPYGVAKKTSDGTHKPILTVEKLVQISTTDPKYRGFLANMKALQREQSKEFAVPSLQLYKFLIEGAEHKAQTHFGGHIRKAYTTQEYWSWRTRR